MTRQRAQEPFRFYFHKGSNRRRRQKEMTPIHSPVPSRLGTHRTATVELRAIGRTLRPSTMDQPTRCRRQCSADRVESISHWPGFEEGKKMAVVDKGRKKRVFIASSPQSWASSRSRSKFSRLSPSTNTREYRPTGSRHSASSHRARRDRHRRSVAATARVRTSFNNINVYMNDQQNNSLFQLSKKNVAVFDQLFSVRLRRPRSAASPDPD
jgi:hypothetical protein